MNGYSHSLTGTSRPDAGSIIGRTLKKVDWLGANEPNRMELV
jgi:hypothetical protein